MEIHKHTLPTSNHQIITKNNLTVNSAANRSEAVQPVSKLSNNTTVNKAADGAMTFCF